MRFLGRTLLATAVAMTAFTASAKPDEAAINSKMNSLGLKTVEISASPVSGLNEVVTDRGILYMNDDASYFLAGNLFKSEDGAQPVNLTEQKMAKLNKDKLKGMEDEMIVYPAKDEKYVVTVFTDTSCGYCRKLHNEMQAYNDAGITIRYLAFPRGGKNSRNFGEMSAIWAAKDRVKAMNAAKEGTFDENGPKNDAMIMKQYDLGVAMGVSGTPALVLEDGTMLPGYQPAAMLRKMLDSRS
ncbi:bifunctional protein-disulfide isomerase/oxidoreductase DsbC [Photobacterium aphoticum]|uniref:Thiol:disulfide interchange protein n=1 Tax=Photobacterium aphoticum TaxID=754436 RepID=A0A090REK9_9GAMM|nr:bifunctional protein-disulfide isomerase/oxidoreductase DsbC [Photobacterium aphoticum]KLV00777.1 protein-disulfide isomerase [Photobacterium aphoticum]PSU49351.1 bifunctional protein-disulfide isomerase/oxidoreductase DsbC [Photobacterium aphoticum]GAL05972.1 thiol:disulfide interchange protein DsbC [Photobacterium aphoticum]GHA51080.1 thiol:disulfide interchange protein DsbC [Photobacterium aphoticum]